MPKSNCRTNCHWCTVAHNCHGKSKNFTAKAKTSRQNQKPHGKTKNLTAKANTSRQNQKPHGKNKYFTAKANSTRQKQIRHSKSNYFTAKPKTSLFPIYMHSLLEFKLKFSRGGINDFETIRRARLTTMF